MTYLTRVELPTGRATVRRRLSSRQVMHAIVAAACPEPSVTGGVTEGRNLWRLDGSAPDFTLYILSGDRPDLNHLVQEFGLGNEHAATRDYEPLLAALQSGQEWRFRMRANPSKAVRREGRRSSRVAIRGEADQVGWLLGRAEKWGFTVPTNRLGVPEVLTRDVDEEQFRRGPGSVVTLAGTTFDGILQIEDADTLRSAIVSGMGHGRAYGLGLMTLAAV